MLPGKTRRHLRCAQPVVPFLPEECLLVRRRTTADEHDGEAVGAGDVEASPK